jgi:murein DD-endopeptidase MepM/ murein hydrolase activator NlpD
MAKQPRSWAADVEVRRARQHDGNRTMPLRRRYKLLYLPDSDGPSREFAVPRWTILTAGALLVGLLLLAGLYVVDLSAGVAWRPGGSPLVAENNRLQREAARFEARVAAVQADLDILFSYQRLVAGAVDLEPLHAEVRAAGVGGREPLPAVADSPVLAAVADLESLLRQARIQRRGMVAILDTLSSRQELRDRIPSIRPCDIGWISSRFGMRRDPFTGKQAFHRGLDFSLPVGTPVRATADGVVTAVEKQRGLGRLVKIDHGGGVETLYGHLQEAKVKHGEHVVRGQVIALSGSSGRSTAPHLHYEVRLGGRAVNPLSYILDSYAELR